MKVRDRYKMLTNGAHNMKNSINTVNLTNLKRESMTIVKVQTNRILFYVGM